jgi:hypothetical protein
LAVQNHLGVNAAAEALERAPRTIKRALRGVPPDSHERGQPRWRLPTIIQALQSTGAPMVRPHSVPGSGEDDRLEQECRSAFEKFDAAAAALEKLPTLKQRRARAVELGPMAAASIAAMRARDEAAGLHEQHVDLKAQEVLRLMVWGFLAPCRWTKDEAWGHLVSRNGNLTEEGPSDDR